MVVEELPIDTSGLWSPVQARRVLDIVNPIAAVRGVVFRQVEVSTLDSYRRVILVAYCREHDIAIAVDSVCGWCKLLK